MDRELFDYFLDNDKFTATSYWLYVNRRYSILTVEEIHRICPIDVSEGYLRKTVSFVRYLWDSCYDSLPDNVQKCIVWTEENNGDGSIPIKDAHRITGYPLSVFQQAYAFMALENSGVFDNPDAYNLGE